MEINYILIPFLIFLARIIDVTIGTIRIIFVSRGIRFLSAVLGFFEVLIWLIAITQIMKNLSSVSHYIAYAAGFGMGNFVGISIERRILMGNLMIQIVTKKDAVDLVQFMSKQGYGVTSINAQGKDGPVKVIFSVVKRKNLKRVIQIIKKFNPNAFYTIEDMQFVTENNLFPLGNPHRRFLRKHNSSFLKRK
ncbi:MAG: DUF2179 domain-containing protein [Candidatus Omnitrophica bacterium]|nr:DUF2179 domain-containing protein [Candidatus Omnitrophota bacterium]